VVVVLGVAMSGKQGELMQANTTVGEGKVEMEKKGAQLKLKKDEPRGAGEDQE